MRISQICVDCQLNKQKKRFHDPALMEEVRRILDSRTEADSAPLLSYKINQLYREHYGDFSPFAAEKKQYNDLVLSMEEALTHRIQSSDDPVRTALFLARTGNYIDYGALPDVSEEEFINLLSAQQPDAHDELVYQSFLSECKKAGSFLLLADNCGEIVLDRLLLQTVKERFPDMRFTVLVRGAGVLNDVTPEDAAYAGIGRIAKIVSNGEAIAGTIYERLPEEAKEAVDTADLILSKGQGNFESFAGEGRHAFYLFLCKCPLFTERFHVPPLTGMFVQE